MTHPRAPKDEPEQAEDTAIPDDELEQVSGGVAATSTTSTSTTQTVSGRDAGSGMATGRRQYSPL